jgi:hypothetical protein
VDVDGVFVGVVVDDMVGWCYVGNDGREKERER